MLLSLFVYNKACKVLYHVIQSFEKYERDFESEFYGLLTVASACSLLWIVYFVFFVGECTMCTTGGISVELITPNVIKLTLPPYLEIVVRRNQKLNLTQKTFEASQSVHRYQDALKTFFPGYFGRSCDHRALLPIIVLGDVIAVDSYGVMLSKSKESIDTNKRN